MTDIRATTSNPGELGREFRAASAKLTAGVVPVAAKFGALLLTKVRANASGRPGPRAITGDYRRSWALELRGGTGARGVATAVVGTNRPQARRLEYGFVGQDALGRHVRQPPYAHADPALDAIGPAFEAAVERLAEL